MDTDSINDRFKYLIAQLFDGNTTKFGREFNIPQSTMKDIIGAKQNAPSLETLKKIISNKKYKVNPDWLILNEGEYQRSQSDKIPEDTVEKINDLREVINLQKRVLASQEEELKRLRGS